MIKLRPDNCQDCRFWVRHLVRPDIVIPGCAFHRFERSPEGQCEVGIKRDTGAGPQ